MELEYATYFLIIHMFILITLVSIMNGMNGYEGQTY